MSQILSRPVPAFDISAASFQGAARDVGEVIAYLAGGIRPDPDTISRLSVSMRVLQGFLLEEAGQQAGRESIGDADRLCPVTVPVVVAHPYDPKVKTHRERLCGVSA